jgi:phosphohistidine swiveling domain-containing protein
MNKLEKLSGRVICKGFVEGQARVINRYQDLDSVQKGDIIVTSQTDMNYVPFLLECGGLITERGGRYSHAAIFSRENDLTCITNVEEARSKIGDHNYIVLDANRNEIYGGENGSN